MRSCWSCRGSASGRLESLPSCSVQAGSEFNYGKCLWALPWVVTLSLSVIDEPQLQTLGAQELREVARAMMAELSSKSATNARLPKTGPPSASSSTKWRCSSGCSSPPSPRRSRQNIGICWKRLSTLTLPRWLRQQLGRGSNPPDYTAPGSACTNRMRT